MLNKSEIDINLIKEIYEKDKETAAKYHFSKCKKDKCFGIYHQANYGRKPRGITPEADEYFSFRFSFSCSVCRLRFTCESVRFLGRKVYVAFFIMIILYPQVEEIQKKLIQLPPRTLSAITVKRWFSWWDIIIPKSPIWKTLVGFLVANVDNLFLPIFLMQNFIQEYSDFNKSLLMMLKFISPISVPANYPPFDCSLSWNQNFTQKMKVLKSEESSYVEPPD